MPICGNMLCSCNNPESDARRNYARKYSRSDDNFTLLKSAPVLDCSTESILCVMEEESNEYVSFRPSGFYPMWIIDNEEFDNEKSKYVKLLRCRYSDSRICDCSARIKLPLTFRWTSWTRCGGLTQVPIVYWSEKTGCFDLKPTLVIRIFNMSLAKLSTRHQALWHFPQLWWWWGVIS